jgi:hypothetical protein
VVIKGVEYIVHSGKVPKENVSLLGLPAEEIAKKMTPTEVNQSKRFVTMMMEALEKSTLSEDIKDWTRLMKSLEGSNDLMLALLYEEQTVEDPSGWKTAETIHKRFTWARQAMEKLRLHMRWYPTGKVHIKQDDLLSGCQIIRKSIISN